MEFFPSQQQRQKRQCSESFFMMLACFMLFFMLEALHIAEQTSDEQCWKVSNQMHKIHRSFMLLK